MAREVIREPSWQPDVAHFETSTGCTEPEKLKLLSQDRLADESFLQAVKATAAAKTIILFMCGFVTHAAKKYRDSFL